ncbi:MAG: UbiD family decarboxylase [Thermodesulfobacteriota bacterium]
MSYRNLSECLRDLEATGRLKRIDVEVDADQQIAAVQRRVFKAKGPALLFTRVKGTPFPMAGNIFGTMERMRFIFRKSLRGVESLFRLKLDPTEAFKRPWKHLGVPGALLHALPRKVKDGPVLANRTSISRLPQLRSWPMDGGGFVTLPLVYTESPSRPGLARSNIGMYRVQLTGNSYAPDREIGLHYQIHRGIGNHHAEALARGETLKVNIFVGGPPSMTVAAVMPLPEGMPELFFAGALGGRRIDMITRPGGLPIMAEADFCITGRIAPGRQLPEGPFGDHLGYYSLAHDFPVLEVDEVHHRPGAVWPFTTVGRPPQEDTVFGAFIHELTAPLVSTVFSGVREVHAVDEAGVHPLLLAIGSERYVPYAAERSPQELLANALSLLGTTQTALSKYVLIAAGEDDPGLGCHNVPNFFRHMLERLDPARDLHFITRTTIDTLDYSGTGLNQGSKVVIAAAGAKRRELGKEMPAGLRLAEGFTEPRILSPGILVVQGPRHAVGRDQQDPLMEEFARTLSAEAGLEGFPLLVVADDSGFTAANWANFLWVTFSRSDPATDTYGAGEFTHCKHWGCRGPVIIDARLKTYHAPPLDPDPEAEKFADSLGARGGPLHGVI